MKHDLHDWHPTRVQPYNEIVCACERCGIVQTPANADQPCPGDPADRAAEIGGLIVLGLLIVSSFLLLLLILAAKQ